MAETNQIPAVKVQAGDAAVDGLFGGIIAGLAMAAYLVISGTLAGDTPGAVLGRFASGEEVMPLRGALLHLAVSAVYGTLFGLGYQAVLRTRRSALSGWLAGSIGIVYGLALSLLAWFVILPGLESPLQSIPFVHFIVGHAIFGLVMGFYTHRFESRRR